MSEVMDILVKVRDLLAVPERWTKGTFARSASGTPTFAFTKLAVRFCIEGAIRHVSSPSVTRDWAQDWIADEIYKTSKQPSIARWNDDPAVAHPDVTALLDRAISMARIGEQIGEP